MAIWTFISLHLLRVPYLPVTITLIFGSQQIECLRDKALRVTYQGGIGLNKRKATILRLAEDPFSGAQNVSD